MSKNKEWPMVVSLNFHMTNLSQKATNNGQEKLIISSNQYLSLHTLTEKEVHPLVFTHDDC